jgi:hypothetical protein
LRGYCTIIFQKILFSEKSLKTKSNGISNDSNASNRLHEWGIIF